MEFNRTKYYLYLLLHKIDEKVVSTAGNWSRTDQIALSSSHKRRKVILETVKQGFYIKYTFTFPLPLILNHRARDWIKHPRV